MLLLLLLLLCLLLLLLLCLLQVLMGSLALRRTKASTGPDGRPLVALPSKTVQMVTLDLGPDDAAAYTALEEEVRKLVRRARGGGGATELALAC
jgi:hypothetical protein